jgi:hypothetical protein
MKDAIHHLKSLQRKVIQSSRKAEANAEVNHNSEQSFTLNKPSGGAAPSKGKKMVLRKMFVKQRFH